MEGIISTNLVLIFKEGWTNRGWLRVGYEKA
jgi:hypothetical protein